MKKIIEKRKVFTIICFCIIGSLLIGLTVKVININQQWGDSQKIVLEDCKVYGYNKEGQLFVNQVGDAHLQLPQLNQFVGGITLVFSEPVEQPLNITVYYAEEDHGYNNTYTETVHIRQGQQSASLLLGKEITTCRIDIGTKVEERFSLDSIVINDENTKFLKIFEPTIIVLFLIFVVIGIYFLVLFNFGIEKFFAIFIMGVGIFYLIVITPLSPPDEPHHYQSAYQLSNFLLFQWDDNDMGNSADFDYTQLAGHYNISNGYLKIFQEIGKPAQEGELIQIPAPRGLDYFVEYLPQATGIAIARITNQNFITTFLFGRLCNLTFYVVCIYFAVKRAPKFKMLIGTVGILPMAIHQAASFSYDGFINGVSLFLISSLLKAIYEKGLLSKRDFGCILISGMLLAPTKVVYAALLLLVILIPKERFKNTKERVLKIAVIFISVLAILMVFRGIELINKYGVETVKPNWEGKNSYTLSYIIENPISTIQIFINTFISQVKIYLYTCIGSILSGLSLGIPSWITNMFLVILCLSSFNYSNSDFKLRWNVRAVFLLTSFGVIAFVMLSMFLGHTSEGKSIIEGVQGRYFIPILPLLAMSLNNQTIVLKKNIEKIELFILLALHGAVINQILNYTMVR
ncbi:MAG TPA: DUF2142 domain-containing protein [Firmicutes bacterium]|nr:DUF2142 domain-containing protein [Bacillota bacterium]